MPRKPSLRYLFRLWGEGWQIWSLDSNRRNAVMVADGGERPVMDRKAGFVLALPARLVIAVPIWVESADPEIATESIRLTLDLKGLLNRKRQPTPIFRTIHRQAERTLVLAMVFPSELPDFVPPSNYGEYEASPLVLSLAEDAVTFWREGTNLVVAFTRGLQCVYWETADITPDAREISNWISNSIASLLSERIIETFPRLVNLDRNLKEVSLFAQDEGTQPQSELSIPSLASANCEWKPPSVMLREEQIHRGKRIQATILSGAGVYALLILGILGYIWKLDWDAKALRDEAEALHRETKQFESIARQWGLIEPSIESSLFPLEVIHQVVMHLPSDGIRLTAFSLSDRGYHIEGEASAASVASRFYEALSSEPELARFQWEMGAPALLPNNSARFQIEGKRR